MKVASNVSATTTCGAAPLIVTASSVSGADGQPASQVTVTYQTLSLIPIPGLLQKQFWISYTVQFRLRS
jgi:hypothetical protein